MRVFVAEAAGLQGFGWTEVKSLSTFGTVGIAWLAARGFASVIM